jgi:glutathionylspermidine synthase
MKLQSVKPLTNEFLEEIGFLWHTDEGTNNPYLSDKLIEVSEQEAEMYYEAANELYDMFAEAGEYVIENDLFHELGIPFNLVDAIKESWENDVHWHLLGRFDFAGGLDGEPIKLIEFNADTPTSIFETAITQWALLKANNLDEESQFNSLYEALGENFKRLITLDESVEEFDELYDGWKILFSSIRGSSEDEGTTKLLERIANEAGFETNFCFVDEVEFNDQEGISYDGVNYEFWFKLVPWEDIAIEEGELANILTDIMINRKAIILNPAYTLMFQSKAFMKILWDLYPEHPLLLETSFEPLEGAYVEKKVFGREGANVTIVDEDGKIFDQQDGPYDNYNSIYQEFTPLNRDSEGNFYQAGVFYSYEACALGFRKSARAILEDNAQFAGHIIKN